MRDAGLGQRANLDVLQELQVSMCLGIRERIGLSIEFIISYSILRRSMELTFALGAEGVLEVALQGLILLRLLMR